MSEYGVPKQPDFYSPAIVSFGRWLIQTTILDVPNHPDADAARILMRKSSNIYRVERLAKNDPHYLEAFPDERVCGTEAD